LGLRDPTLCLGHAMEYNTPSSGPETPKRAVVDKIKGAERYGLGKASGQGGFFESQWGVFHGGVFESKVFFYYCVGALSGGGGAKLGLYIS
jgi:hypothetical protein